jgi:transposase
MRGDEPLQGGMFSYIMPEQRVPRDHPLRKVRKMVDAALKEMSPLFNRIYADRGRPSIAPEKLLRALVIQMLYSIRSERMLVEQLEYNILFRWFVGLSMDDRVWDVTVFTKNRDRLLKGDVASAFLEEVLKQAHSQGLTSDEHFTVDGTLIEAWAGQKSFKKKNERVNPPDDPGNPTVNFHGEKRTNQTHASTTDPDALLYRKGPGKETKLSYCGHVTMEHRNGLVVAAMLTQATGKAEREAALKMMKRIKRRARVTMAGDKGYNVREFVTALREMNVTPHVAHKKKFNAIDGRTTRHPGYEISQRARKRVEEIFGWMKTVGTLRKTRHKGRPRVGWMFTFAAACYNLVRMKNLTVEAT